MGCSERNYEYFEKHLVDAVWDIHESNVAIKTKKLDIEKLLTTSINQPVRKKIPPSQVLVSMANRGGSSASIHSKRTESAKML